MGSRELGLALWIPLKTERDCGSTCFKNFVLILKLNKKPLPGIFLQHAPLLNTPEPFYKPVQ